MAVGGGEGLLSLPCGTEECVEAGPVGVSSSDVSKCRAYPVIFVSSV
jgi:hypothetical protein